MPFLEPRSGTFKLGKQENRRFFYIMHIIDRLCPVGRRSCRWRIGTQDEVMFRQSGLGANMNNLCQSFGNDLTSWILASLTLDYTQDFAKHLTISLI